MFGNVDKEVLKRLELTEVDIREDEEQTNKFQKILEILTMAGYYRTRIKGLSNFDKWLVIESVKTREKMAEYVHSFALNQFKKNHVSNDNHIEKLYHYNLTTYIELMEKAYEPQRRFKQKNTVPTDEFSIVTNTLLEYGDTFKISQKIIDKLQERKSYSSPQDKEIAKEIIESKIQEKSSISSNVFGKIVNIQAQEVARAAEQYTTLSTSIIENNKLPSNAFLALKKQKLTLENKIKKIFTEKKDISNKLRGIIDCIQKAKAKKQKIDLAFRKIKNIGSCDNKKMLLKLEELLLIHDSLKDQENKFRDKCHLDLNMLNGMIEKVQLGELREKTEKFVECEEQKEVVNQLRLQLAKKNRAIAILTRQLDDVPGRSELTQYQRRFLELYNQVSAKHKETKQYYTLYNTLDDTKLYFSKELLLLNSIQDNYTEAMASTSGKEQFVKQFELIIDGVQRNKTKVEKRCAEEKNRRDTLSCQLTTLMEQQRKYVAAVRQLTIECRKNETLLARLRGS